MVNTYQIKINWKETFKHFPPPLDKGQVVKDNDSSIICGEVACVRGCKLKSAPVDLILSFQCNCECNFVCLLTYLFILL